MVAFIYGFLVFMVIGIIWLNVRIEHFAAAIENLLTVGVGGVILAFILYQGGKSLWIYIKPANRKCTDKAKCNGYCLLIVGEWGSGKTTLYKNVFKNKKNINDIYISCFSANKAELISQLGQESFFWKICSLNGILSKLLENNWRTFMPKRRVVVFDDLERLHSGKNNYVDLIGVIDYLKENKCDIILLANYSNIKDNVFQTYMERIVDDICTPIIDDVKYICKDADKRDFKSSQYKKQFYRFMGVDDEKSIITDELIDQILKVTYDQIDSNYKNRKFTNIRVIKKILLQIKPYIQKKISENNIKGNNDESKIGGIILESLLADEILKIANAHKLLYFDYPLFSEVLEFFYNPFHNVKYRDDPPNTNTDPKKYNEELTVALKKYQLNPDYFGFIDVNINNIFEKQLDYIAGSGKFEKHAFEHLGEIIMMVLRYEDQSNQSSEEQIMKIAEYMSLYFLDDVISESEHSSDRYECLASEQYTKFYKRVNSFRTYIMDKDRINRLVTHFNKIWEYGVSIDDYYNGLVLLIISYKYNLETLQTVLIKKLKISLDTYRDNNMSIDNLLSVNSSTLKQFSLWFLEEKFSIKTSRDVMKKILTSIKTDLTCI